MKLEFLELLKCPYCGTDLKVGDTYEAKEGKLISGSVKCECSTFTVLEGILNLKISPLNRFLARLVREENTGDAAALSLWSYAESLYKLASFLESTGTPGKLLGKMVLGLGQAMAQRTHRKYSDSRLSFYQLLGSSPAEMYLKHRFSAESLWSLYPFVPLLKLRKGRILDLGCGVGHASSILSSCVEPGQLVCADTMFSNLYLAKKYFAQEAEYICLDANYPLPFKEGVFDTVLMLDAFHYVEARALLAVEMQRILNQQGLLLLLHLHNSLIPNPAPGVPLSPSGWANLFQQLPVKLLPERNSIEDFALNDRLDLAKEYTMSELNSARALVIAGTRDKALYHVYPEVASDFLCNKGNLIINPIYSINHAAERLVLQRKFPNETFRKEYPFTEGYLPERYHIEGELAQVLRGRTLDIASRELSEQGFLCLEELMRKFIIINVPANYY